MTTLQEDVRIRVNILSLYPDVWQSSFASRLVKDLPELSFFVLSDVWLDHPDTFPGLRRIFDNCLENEFVPKVIILCGNFTSTGIAHGSGRDLQRYQGENLDERMEALC
jgi:DNA polymerase epsilon subunit 2